VAEESTAWPRVTGPANEGGLGFSYKWNMGWMHDSLHYMQEDPLFRQYHHHDVTFGLVYAFSERFILPISHDEVVHGKRSLLDKMWGDRQQRLAQVRAYLGFMWAHPGKKLLFMGCEFAQTMEWNHDASLEWHLLDDPGHRGVQRLVRDLNSLYLSEAPLHASDATHEGFSWVIGDDKANSVFAFIRHVIEGAAAPLLVVCNMTPVARSDYRIGVPDIQGCEADVWCEVLNTDAQCYGGSGQGNGGVAPILRQPSHGHAVSLVLHLPPLSTLILRRGNA
ncbi:MAG: alpha amylase C-terminal domain-containing protein, partial [Burkholderiaceae bacterium]|nr:alpha amylase C-terminal domain-containing protein [Burkholderiaceae bacterium]